MDNKLEVRTTDIEHNENPGRWNLFKKRLECLWHCITKKQIIFAYVEDQTTVKVYYAHMKTEHAGDTMMQIGEDLLSSSYNLQATKNIIKNDNNATNN